jgi:hypothetical protein
MSDERRDDEIIGRALSRAIETIDVNQTPFERSRIASAPARRSIFGLWQIATAAAAVVLALAIGSWLTRPTEGQPGVAASPTTPAASASAPAPSATASAVVATSVPTWVYFARDGLPPVGAFVSGYAPTIASQGAHISERLSALRDHASGQVPSGASNPMSLVATNAGGGGAQTSMGITLSTQGDLATVEFDLVPGWGVRGAAQSQALLQQLVYTITEEPGIRRALITEKGKPQAIIDQLVVDKPLTREDVSGYTARGSVDPLQIGGASSPAKLTTNYSVDSLAPGLARFVITFDYGTSSASNDPQFSAGLIPATNETTGKAELEITIPNGSDTTTTATQVDRSPLRWIAVGKSNSIRAQVYRLGLDDQRPWRAMVLSNPTRIVIDIGGLPRAVSDRIAVYRAQVFAATPACSTTCDLELSGAARVFEANVVWRVKDGAGKVIANGHFLTSLGTSAVWGTFDTSIQLPSGFTGNATLELYEASPKDGSEQGLVQIPLMIR